MPTPDTRTPWEGAAPGWARWKPIIAAWMEPATEAMLDMAGVGSAARVPEPARAAAWAEVREALETFESATEFVAPAEVLVAGGAKPA